MQKNNGPELDPSDNSRIDKGIQFSKKNAFSSMVILLVIGIGIRFAYFPHDIPFTYDSLDYFGYALKTSQVGSLPEGWALANNGWPIFVSFFFNTIEQGTFFEYMWIQRSLSIIISSLTAIPVYFLAHKFFRKEYAILGAAFFILEPRMIIDSLGGGNMPLYIFLTTSAISLFLSNNKKLNYISFCIIALSVFVRYEGLLVIIPFSIMFFVRLRKDNLVIPKYIMVLSIFILVLLPMMYLKIEANGEDGITSHIAAGFRYIQYNIIQGVPEPGYEPGLGAFELPKHETWLREDQSNMDSFVVSVLTGFASKFSWMLIPFFILLIPIAFIIVIKEKKFKQIDWRSTMLILSSFFLLIPAFYAYGRHLEEIKYIFPIIPILLCFCIIPLEKFKKKLNVISISIITVLIVVSIFSINYKDLDYEHEVSAFEASRFVVDNSSGINAFSPESRYIKTANFENNWPEIPDVSNYGHIMRETERFHVGEHESLNEFILEFKDDGLSHIFVDNTNDRAKFFTEVFQNEKDYPFLIKEYDSLNLSNYHVKIYRIDYELFDTMH